MFNPKLLNIMNRYTYEIERDAIDLCNLIDKSFREEVSFGTQSFCNRFDKIVEPNLRDKKRKGIFTRTVNFITGNRGLDFQL